MNFRLRAFRYVTRKKSKTLVLLAIMVVANVMILGNMSVLLNVREQKDILGEKSGSKLSVASSNSAIKMSDVTSATALDNVTWANCISSSTANAADFEPASGAEGDDDGQCTLHGYDDTSADGPFAAQLLRLSSGEHLHPESSYEVLLHDNLAAANGLSAGDKITLQSSDGQPVEALVKGLYQSSGGDSQVGPSVTSPYLPANQIYADHQLLAAISGEQGYSQVYLYLRDPGQLEETKKTLEQLFDECEITAYDALWRRMQFSLAQTERIAGLILMLTVMTSVLAIVLLLCLWTRERMREFAILLALGNPTWKIYLQVLIEVTLIFACAVIVAFFTSSIVINLLDGTATGNSIFTALDVHLSATELLILICGGMLCLSADTVIALVPLVRTTPKTILSRAD